MMDHCPQIAGESTNLWSLHRFLSAEGRKSIEQVGGDGETRMNPIPGGIGEVGDVMYPLNGQ